MLASNMIWAVSLSLVLVTSVFSFATPVQQVYAQGEIIDTDTGLLPTSGEIIASNTAPNTAPNTGGGCDGDCTAPTLGVNNDGTRLVEGGFTYNEKQIDVERYFTSYPLVTVNVGVQNKAVFKIYDNLGPDNIRHFGLAFGLATGQIMGTSNAMILWDKSFAGTETVTLVDPHNALDNVQVLTSDGKCRADSTFNDCLIVTVFHTFRESLESDIVGTNVWDLRRNGWQNYYNHGIHIEGQSLNPPDEYVGIHKGKLIHLFETGKNTAVDEQGNTWTLTFDKTWKMDFIPKGEIDRGVTMHGIDRNNNMFSTYKMGQVLLAEHKLNEILGERGIYNSDEENSVETIEFKYISRADDKELQANIANEKLRAEQLFKQLYNTDIANEKLRAEQLFKYLYNMESWGNIFEVDSMDISMNYFEKN